MSSLSCMHPISAAEGFSQSEAEPLSLKPFMDFLLLVLSCGSVSPCDLQSESFSGWLCAMWKVAPVVISVILLEVSPFSYYSKNQMPSQRSWSSGPQRSPLWFRDLVCALPAVLISHRLLSSPSVLKQVSFWRNKNGKDKKNLGEFSGHPYWCHL